MNTSAITNSAQTIGIDARQRAKLVDAAQQFEGIFLQELLKPMQSGKDGLSGEDASDSSTDTLQSYSTEAVARAISSRGGFGIASQVIQQLERSSIQNENNQKIRSTG
jgi:flagellar protein FlgJ